MACSTRPCGARRRRSACSCSASPTKGAAPTERTEVTLLHDERPPLRRRRGARPRAAPRHRHADGARRQPDGRRSHRDPARHLSRSAQRVLLRDQPFGRAGRRARHQRTAQHRLGRDLGRAHAAHRRRVDGGVRHSVQEPELPRARRRRGASTSPARSIASWKRTAGRARASIPSSCRCRRRAKSAVSTS